MRKNDRLKRRGVARFSAPWLSGLAALLTISSGALARDPVRFEDPEMKGSLIAYDYPVLPSEYHGTWADFAANCYATADRGRQVTLTENAIGFDRFVKVEGYSDHPAVLVTARSQDGEFVSVFLDISLDGTHISVRPAGTEATEVLVRCPPPTEHSESASIAHEGWLSQVAGACQTGEFSFFLEAFMYSDFVQRRYLAPRIRIISPARTVSIPAHQYRPLPIRQLDYRYVLNDGSKTPVEVTVSELDGGGYRLDWQRKDRADDETYPSDEEEEAPKLFGPPGWLIFERTPDCWQLVEDGTGF